MRISTHDSGAARWEMAQAAPAPQLQYALRRYCGFRERSTVPMCRREVPSGRVAVILSLGSTIEVRDAARRDVAPQRLESFVASLHESASLTEYTGNQHGIQVDLSPLGAHMLFGLPMHELTNRVIELESIWGAAGALLVERLHGTPGWQERFEVLDEFLGARLAGAPRAAPEVAWAVGRLNRTGGRVSIGGLVEETGWSHRRLIARFREQVGLPPKALARILRFERAASALRDGSARPADVAYDCGYYDQAHLNREFRRLAATTPSDYAARALPNGGGVAAGNFVQDGAGAAA